MHSMHHAANPLIRFTGENSAEATWSLYFSNILADQRLVTDVGIIYNDDYVRRGGWYIKKTVSRKHSILVQKIAADGTPQVLVLGAESAPEAKS
jgi:hypothetical protein